MKIAWLLVVWTWVSSSGDVTTQLRFATDESLEEIREDETHRLTPVQLETSPGVPLAHDQAATWSQIYYQLLISCNHGTLQLDREAEKKLVDTTFLCVSRDGDFQQSRSIGVVTSAQEAQQILSSIVYKPDLNYHSTWFGVTDPLCITGNDGNEMVRMQLSPVNGDAPQPSTDTCVALDLRDNSVLASEAGSTHEKKISVTSVNDRPTVDREPGRDLSLHSGGSCIGLSGFTLDDAEAAAVESDPKAVTPILTLQINVKVGKLRVDRRSALQSGIHAVGSGKNTGDVALAWKNPDLFDSSLTLKGAISDLQGFLPQVEYCSSPDASVTVPDTLRVTLSDNGFCGDFGKESLSASLVVPVHIPPAADLGELLVSNTNITVTKHSAPVPLNYAPGKADTVECTIELQCSDGMLLGIDYQEGTLYGKANTLSLDEPRASAKVAMPTRGLIVRFWSDKSKGESANFKFTRNICGIQEVCRQLESATLYEDSTDEAIIAGAQTLALNSESVTELQVIRYRVSRLWLIWNIPETFSQAIVASTQSRVSVQTVGRRFRLQGKRYQIAAQLRTLNVYSLMGGMRSYNRLNVTISTLIDGAIRSQDVLSSQQDIFALPVLENIELLHPLELVLDESSEISLETTLISYPSTYVSSTPLRWTVRSALGSIWWDPSSVNPAVVSRQISNHELELRGNLGDLNAALSSVRVDERDVQDDYKSFRSIYEEQASELFAGKTLFRDSIVNSESEIQLAVDTISMYLETLDNSTLVVSGAIYAWIPRKPKKLGIRLPASYLQVDLDQTLTIVGVSFEGYAHKLNFTISCTKGALNLLHKQTGQPILNILNKPADSRLNISGYFSTLGDALRYSQLLYYPQADATGYDELVFTIESPEDQAMEILPIVINSPIRLPSLTVPVSPISVLEHENVSITGVTLNVAGTQVFSRGITINITARSGHVELMTDERNSRSQNNTNIQIQDDAENINAILKGLRYRSPVTGAPTEDQILFSMHWTSDSEGQVSPLTFSISIKIFRRPLTFSVLLGGKVIGDSSVVTTTMNTPVSLENLLIIRSDSGGDSRWSHCDRSAPAVPGVDGNPCSVTLELSFYAGLGLISNRTEPFSQRKEQGTSLSLVCFVGTVTQANAFLHQQVYVPDPKFYGPDQVVINIKHATSATREEVMAEDTILLPVFVSPDCEPPQLFWADSGTNTMSFSSSTPAPFMLPELLIAREGLEKGYCQDDTTFRVSVEADQGFLALKSAATAASLDDRRALVLEGRIWDLNFALASVEYQFEIHREDQIPITASIEVRLQGTTSQESGLFAVASSALLRLKFAGDTQLSEMLARETIISFEDTDVLIGDAVNLDRFAGLADDETIIIRAHNGVVYAAADGVDMEARNEQRVSTSDEHHLRLVMSNLHYIPNSDFNGIDEIVFRTQNQENTLYIYVQAENDPPEFAFDSNELKDWYRYPRKFIPSFQLNDPDKGQTFQVDVRVENGSLFLDHMSSSTFDGVTVELRTLTSSLRMKSRLTRLNTIFLQRLIEVIPNNCVKEGVEMSCTMLIELCVNDGSISVCEELHLPEQNLFYHISVADWAKNLNVSTGSSLNISEAFEIHKEFDVMYDLFLRVHGSAGFIRIDVPSCGELRDVAGTDQLQRSDLIGTTQTIHASDVACLNKALASIQLQGAYGANDSIVVLELFSEEMRLLANASIHVKVTGIPLSMQISTVRTTNANEPWQVRIGNYVNLTSLVHVSILENQNGSHEIKADEDILELNISCSICQWRYQVFVPRVSYEFAQIPNSKLRFLGQRDSLNTVLATLELTIVSHSSSGYEDIQFQLVPVALRLVQGMEPLYASESRIEFRVTATESVQEMTSDEAPDKLPFCSVLQPPMTSLGLRNSSVTIQLKKGEVQPIGDLVVVNGDLNDPTWFRMLARVAHGRLSIPINVCCVDIRETKHENELDVVGSAFALKNAFTATQFRANEHFSGKDSLEVTIAQFSSKHNQPNVSFSIPIEVVAVQASEKNGDTLKSESAFTETTTVSPGASAVDSGPDQDMLDDNLALSFESFDADESLLSDIEVVASIHESEGVVLDKRLAMAKREKNADTKAQSILPLMHIEGSIEGPLSSENWEIISLALRVGTSWSIPGIFIRDGTGKSIVIDDDLVVEIHASIGTVLLTVWDGLQMVKGQDGAFTSAITVVGTMDRLNAALRSLRYQCSGACNHQDTIVLQVTNPLTPPPVFSHQRTIRIDQLYDVPVPRVISEASLYYSTEDAAFQFPDLALQFADSNASRKALDYAQTKQRSQLWSAELSYRPTKYAYPRSHADDRRHRWVADFVGENPPRYLCKVGSAFYFAASDEQHGEELWVSDGSAQGTGMVLDLVPGNKGSSPADLVALNGKLIFTADGVVGREMWASGGNAKQTYLAVDIRQGPKSSNPQYYTLFQSQWLLFQAETDEFGVELFKTDGTAAGTIMVEDIWRGPRSSKPSYFVEWTASDGRARMYFAATSDSGRELWVSDAFSSFNAERNRKPAASNAIVGTFIVADICSGVDSSDPQYLVAIGSLGVFFSATDCLHGRELWFTDGSSTGTRMVKDLNVATNEGSSPSNLVAFGGKVYFQAQTDSSTGRELYVSDGSAAGTLLLVDLVPGPQSSAPMSLSAVGPITLADGTTKNRGLSFTAFDSTGCRNIWISDGTKPGTSPLLDEIFLLSHNLSFPTTKLHGRAQQLLEFGNAVFFITHDLAAGRAVAHEENSPLYGLEIRVNYGTISFIDSLADDQQQTYKGATSQLKLQGTVVKLERDLSRLVYLPPQNWNEEQFPGGHIVEWQFMVSYEDKSVESFADLVIMTQVDAPVISVPQALEDQYHYMNDYLSVLRLECLPLVCDEDTPMILDGFSVRAADTTHTQLSTHDLLVISLSVSHGVISLGDTWRTNCISQFVGAQTWNRVSFKAPVDCMNRVLAAMIYVGEPNFSGADQLKIRVEYARDLDAAFDEVTVPIIVIELNDAPYIDVDSMFYEAEEDIPLVIDNLRLRDPDALDKSLRVVLETNYGQLALLRPNGIKLTTEAVKNAGKKASGLTLEGTLHNLDAAMASVVYTSEKDWNSLQFRPNDASPGMTGFDMITIHSTDLSSFSGSSVSILFVYVDPRPDPVLIAVPSNDETSIYAGDPPGMLRGDEDTWINVSGLAFSSVDDTSQSTLVVGLSVTHGLISLLHVRGLTFLEGTSDKNNILKLKGTFANVNACMVNLRYLPNKNFYGQDSLVVTANALDQYTQQQTPSSSIRVAITVDAVNDAPVWNIGSTIVREIQQGQAASIAGISFYDVDIDVLNCAVELCVMDLIIEASDGFVTLPDHSPPLFSNDMATEKVAYTVISGTPDELNVLLSGMTFELADPEYYRADSPSRMDIKLQLTADDRGTFGWGGPQISTTTVMFSPVTWSRYSLSIVAPEDVLALEEDTTFVFDGDLQLADPDSARSFHNLLELSIACTNGAFALSSRVAGVQVLRNDSDGGIVIRGFFAQLNAALNGSSYIPTANWYGSEELSLSMVELNHLEIPKATATASIFLFVSPVCDEPQWVTLTDDPLTMTEDRYLLIDTLSLTNPDLDDEQREVEVTIDVRHGGVMLSMTRGLLIRQAEYSTSEDRLISQHTPPGQTFSRSRLFFKDLACSGRISDINTALKGMVFKPWLDYNSDGWPVDEITLVATSVCGGNSKPMTSHTTIPITVDAVNDPPVLVSQHFQPVMPSYSLSNLEAVSWRSSIEVIEDAPQRLESTMLDDPDYDLRSGDLRLLVNISCIHCTITCESLSHPSETNPSDDLIVVTRNWKNDEGVQLVVHGNLPSLNIGLMNQLVFQSTINFNGLAFVLVEVSDLGNYGEGGEQRSVYVLGVKVKPVNDIPQIHLPQYQSQEPVLQLDEDDSVLIQGAPALSAVIAPAQRQSLEWSLMVGDLLANDSSTRLRSLHQFSGSDGLAVSFLVSYNGDLLFSARDADFGQELWCSDGTAAGTVLLKDIFPGSGDSRPSYLTAFSKDNRVYFAAEGPHLSWLVNDDYRDTCQSFRPSSLDPNVFFTVAAQSVWDPEETYDCPLGFRWMSTSEAHQVFVGTIAMEGHSDEPLTYFDQCGWHGYEWGGQTRKYFRFSDSETTGAFKHAGFRDSYRIDTGFQTDLFAGIVCYREPPGYQITWGTQLWTTDGTSEGTTRVARISTDPEGSKPSHFVELNQRLYFQATSTEFGSELWSTDGTRAGTYLIADIEFGSRSSEPRFLTAFDSRVFFSAETLDYGRELWFSDGNPWFEGTEDQHETAGTGLLLDICAGAKSSSPQHFAVLSPAVGSPLLLFQADDCVHGTELWSTDGTRAGSTLVQDIRKGSAGSLPVYLTSFAGQVYFQADDGIHGSEFWTTDGTSTGTVMLFDIAPGVLGSKPSYFTIFDNINAPSGALLFAAQAERDRLTEFWRSDGTSIGITRLFPPSREVVDLNTDSLNLQLAGRKFVSLTSRPQLFFFLGRESGQGLDFQHEAANRISVAHAEDVAYTRSITLQDVESMQNTRELTVSLNCSKGWLSLGRQCGGVTVSLDGTPDNKKAAVFTLKGSLAALNCIVEKVTYHAKPQENGWDEIHVTLGQGVVAAPTNVVDVTARDSSYKVSKRMLVEIRAINDPPIVSMASIFYAPTGAWVVLAGIEITDPDSAEGILYVSIAVHKGKLRVMLPPSRVNGGGPTALHLTADGDTSQMLEFATTAERAKEIFGALEYSCDDDYSCSSSQSDYLTVQVDDNGYTGARGPQVTTKTAEVVVITEAEAFNA